MKGSRNSIKPSNAVFDTAVWSDDQLQSRADHYGMSVEEYKTSNILKEKITSKDVAQLVCCMAGPVFSKSTGVQVPIDGGNERVI